MDGKTGHLAAKYMAIITSLFTLYASHSWLPHSMKNASYFYF